MALNTPWSNNHSCFETFSFSADTASTAFPAYFVGWWLSQAKVKTSADATVTVTIKDSDGATIGTVTTTAAATTGEYIPLAASGYENRYLTGIPTVTISGLGSGTLALTCVLVR